MSTEQRYHLAPVRSHEEVAAILNMDPHEVRLVEVKAMRKIARVLLQDAEVVATIDERGQSLYPYVLRDRSSRGKSGSTEHGARNHRRAQCRPCK